MEKLIAGKTILITGATDGLGKLVATHLAAQKARVLLHGRNFEKGQSVLNDLKRKTGNPHIYYYNADFAALEDVHSLGEKLLNEQEHIDVLINNAGMGAKKREINKTGIELTLAVNYFAPVLLTEKLLPIIPPDTGNIINVASASQEVLDFSDFMMEVDFDGVSAYSKSKTALIMYTVDLAERLRENGIRVNTLHPATLMNTKMVLNYFGYSQSSVEDGASALEALLTIGTTGNYYHGKNLTKPIQQVYDPESRKRLRQLTLTILKDYR